MVRKSKKKASVHQSVKQNVHVRVHVGDGATHKKKRVYRRASSGSKASGAQQQSVPQMYHPVYIQSGPPPSVPEHDNPLLRAVQDLTQNIHRRHEESMDNSLISKVKTEKEPSNIGNNVNETKEYTPVVQFTGVHQFETPRQLRRPIVPMNDIVNSMAYSDVSVSDDDHDDTGGHAAFMTPPDHHHYTSEVSPISPIQETQETYDPGAAGAGSPAMRSFTSYTGNKSGPIDSDDEVIPPARQTGTSVQKPDGMDFRTAAGRQWLRSAEGRTWLETKAGELYLEKKVRRISRRSTQPPGSVREPGPRVRRKKADPDFTPGSQFSASKK